VGSWDDTQPFVGKKLGKSTFCRIAQEIRESKI